MTGRLQPGDRVRTVNGDGVVVATYAAVDGINPAVFHIVELDDSGRRQPVRDDRLELLSRQLTMES